MAYPQFRGQCQGGGDLLADHVGGDGGEGEDPVPKGGLSRRQEQGAVGPAGEGNRHRLEAAQSVQKSQIERVVHLGVPLLWACRHRHRHRCHRYPRDGPTKGNPNGPGGKARIGGGETPCAGNPDRPVSSPADACGSVSSPQPGATRRRRTAQPWGRVGTQNPEDPACPSL